MCLRAELGARIADKTVLKMMRELGIRCGIRRETDYHRYNSYRGPVGERFDNLIARDFRAGAPWEKLGTDVTEFRQPWGKAYFAPVYDFCTKEIVSWSVSTSPDMAQQEEVLVSVNIFFTIFTNVFSPIAPTRMRRIRQRGCAAFGV